MEKTRAEYKQIMAKRWKETEAQAKREGMITNIPYGELTPEEKKMKTEYYTYNYERKKNDVNGNPRHYATIYRIKSNKPILIKAKEDIGYRDPKQAVEDVIEAQHKWNKKYVYSANGYNEHEARRLRRLGKIIVNQV